MDGYICLYRKILNSELWRDHDTTRLFLCLLLLANTEEGWEYMGNSLHAGQLIISIDRLADRCGLTRRKIRTGLDRLKRGEMIETARWKNGMAQLVTICNYQQYQFEYDGTPNGIRNGTPNGTRETSAKTRKSNGYNGGNKKSGTPNGTPNGIPNGTHPENGILSGTPFGTPNGIRNGTRKSDVSTTKTDDYTDNVGESGIPNGTRNGTQNGTIQYIECNNINNIDSNNNINSIKNQQDFTLAELEQMFEDFRKKYKGVKRGFKQEFENFKKKHQQNWKEIIPQLMPALERMEAWRAEQQAQGQFVPQYAMLQTWLNQDRWTIEFGETTNNSSNGGSKVTADTKKDAEYIPNYDEEF